MIDKNTHQIICTSHSNGKKHDFKLFKESKIPMLPTLKVLADLGYQGLQKQHADTQLPIKKKPSQDLSKEGKRANRQLAAERLLVERVIRTVKVFRITQDCYRNRRKRFSLRFNLIAAICNMELIKN